MAPVVPALLMAGKLGLKFLPAIGAVAGAAPGLRRGNLGEAALGAGFGALTGTGGGAISGLTGRATKMAGGLAPKILDPASRAAAALGLLGKNPALSMQAVGATGRGLQTAAQVGIPLAGIAGTAKLASMGGGGGARAASPTLGGAAGLLGYGSIGNEGMGGVPVPPGMGPYGNIGPSGYPLDVISPLGLDAGRRLRTQKDAEALRDATNIVLPTIRKFSEQAKKDDFARSMAAAGIAQNIATNAALTQGMAAATRQLGTTAAQQAGQALTTQYRY